MAKQPLAKVKVVNRPWIEDLVKEVPGLDPPTSTLPREQLKYDAMYALLAPDQILGRSHELNAFQALTVVAWSRSACNPVLCVGAGPGVGVRWLLDRGFDAYGCDISREASRYWDGIDDRMVVCDAHRMPYEDARFGLVVCADVLEHVPTLFVEETIKEVFRVTNRMALIQVGITESLGIRGMHLTLKGVDWWHERISSYGGVCSRGAYDKHAAWVIDKQWRGA